MDEGRDPAPQGGSRAAPIAGELSPIQRAYGRYATHFLKCWDCRDLDRRCDEGEELWRDYAATGDATSRAMGG
jgi:hypothetical protein